MKASGVSARIWARLRIRGVMKINYSQLFIVVMKLITRIGARRGSKRDKLPPDNFLDIFPNRTNPLCFFRAVLPLPPQFQIFCSCSKSFAKVFIISRPIACLVKIADI